MVCNIVPVITKILKSYPFELFLMALLLTGKNTVSKNCIYHLINVSEVLRI